MANLQRSAKQLPLTPGVYIFLDSKNKPLYVGRATSLRRRVSQYFRKDIDPRILEMVGQAKSIGHHRTDTVLDSVILEANLIKKFWPKYNVKDRDDRSFAYMVIPKEDFPHPIIVRGRELAKFPLSQARIFGPYQSASVIWSTLKIVRQIFPYSTCKPTGKPCFDYQIGRCPGVCVGAVSKEDYKKNIDDIILLFKGEKKRLMKKLAKENPMAASALKHIQDVTLISREEFDVIPGRFNRIEGFDISHFGGKETYGSMVVFTGGKADKSQYRLFRIRTVTNNDLDALKEMVERRLKHPEWPRADLILIDGGKPQVEYISKMLKANNVGVPMLGLAKLHGDRLVFPSGATKNFKSLAEATKDVLVRVRDEAHRFAIKAHRRRREKIENF